MALSAVVTSQSGFPTAAGASPLQVDNVSGAVQLGSAGTANGNGARQGASRVILGNKPTAVVAYDAGVTATVTQILEAGIFTTAAAANLTLPTAQGATGLVQALPNAAVGDLIQIVLATNHATLVGTLVAGTGSTIFGIPGNTNGTRIWTGRVTSVTAAAETITWY